MNLCVSSVCVCVCVCVCIMSHGLVLASVADEETQKAFAKHFKQELDLYRSTVRDYCLLPQCVIYWHY